MATRKAIREAVAALIAPHFTSSFSYRNNSVTKDDLPCAFTSIEAGDSDRDFDQEYITTGVLTIEAIVRGEGDLDSQLDALGTLAHQELMEDETLNGLVEGMTRTGFAYDPDPESYVNTLAITYAITYEDED